MKFAFALLALFALVQFSTSAFVGNKGEKSLVNFPPFRIDPFFIFILLAGNIIAIPLEETCTAAGYFPDPDDCAKYYECAALGTGWIVSYLLE